MSTYIYTITGSALASFHICIACSLGTGGNGGNSGTVDIICLGQEAQSNPDILQCSDDLTVSSSNVEIKVYQHVRPIKSVLMLLCTTIGIVHALCDSMDVNTHIFLTEQSSNYSG